MVRACARSNCHRATDQATRAPRVDPCGSADLAGLSQEVWAPSEATAVRTLYVNTRPTSAIQGSTFSSGVGETEATQGLSIVQLGPDPLDTESNFPLTYTWNVTSSAGYVMSNTTSPTPTFKPARGSTHTAYLWVKDTLKAPAVGTATRLFYVNTRPDPVICGVTPTYTAGETAITTGLTTVDLTECSSDADDNPMTREWRLNDISGTDRSGQLSDRFASTPWFVPIQWQTYTVSLAVSDTKRAPAATTPTEDQIEVDPDRLR